VPRVPTGQARIVGECAGDLALVETHVHLKLESMTRNDLADTFVGWRAMTPRCFD